VKPPHNLARVSMRFNDDTPLPNGGLAVAGLLAQRLGVTDLVDARLTPKGPAVANSGVKAPTLIGSALAGGDYVDDANVLRAGASLTLFDEVRAPSTVGDVAAVRPVGGSAPTSTASTAAHTCWKPAVARRRCAAAHRHADEFAAESLQDRRASPAGRQLQDRRRWDADSAAITSDAARSARTDPGCHPAGTKPLFRGTFGHGEASAGTPAISLESG
jgi:hypothetical protein